METVIRKRTMLFAGVLIRQNKSRLQKEYYLRHYLMGITRGRQTQEVLGPMFSGRPVSTPSQ